MKTFIGTLVLAATLALVLLGCTDNPAPVVPSTASEPPLALGKADVTLFTATEYSGPVLSEGEIKFVGNRMIITGMVEQDAIESTCPYMDGTVVITFNASFDANQEGPTHGTYIITPNADFDSGVWEGTWEGFQKMTGPDEWTMSVQQVGHGRGGALEGMKQLAHSVYVNGVGFIEGEIKSH